MANDKQSSEGSHPAGPTRRCRSCGRELVFAKSTQSGKTVPLVAKPVTAYQLTWGGSARPIGQVHISHFVDCPHWQRHKKEKRDG